MVFDEKRCYIPTVYCGKQKSYDKYDSDNGVKYTKKGSSYECMQKGFGAGMYSERKKKIGASSLQTIKYVNEKHEKSFKKDGINTITSLKQKCRNMSANDISKLLKK